MQRDQKKKKTHKNKNYTCQTTHWNPKLLPFSLKKHSYLSSCKSGIVIWGIFVKGHFGFSFLRLYAFWEQNPGSHFTIVCSIGEKIHVAIQRVYRLWMLSSLSGVLINFSSTDIIISRVYPGMSSVLWNVLHWYPPCHQDRKQLVIKRGFIWNSKYWQWSLFSYKRQNAEI